MCFKSKNTKNRLNLFNLIIVEKISYNFDLMRVLSNYKIEGVVMLKKFANFVASSILNLGKIFT